MSQATFHFPRGFLWGTATASHQVEGNNTNNNWWAWEQEQGRIIHGHQSKLACDWWNGRWREDFDRAAAGNQNAHRLSIEWSRIQPAPDRWDEDTLDRYRDMLRGLQERNMTPMVTLHHFSDPLWLYEQGGWENPQAPEYFDKYVRKVVDALKEYANLWITINEPNVYVAEGYIEGLFPPGKKDLGAALSVAGNLLRGHTLAYRGIHSIQPQARVGMALHYRCFEPAKTWFPPDVWVAKLRHNFLNELFFKPLVSGSLPLPFNQRFPEARGTQDFVGVNYYTKEKVALHPLRRKDMFMHCYYPANADLSGTGYLANVPTGLFDVLKWARRPGLPIIVTENGVEDPKDSMRPRYLVEHIHQVWRAANFNWQIKGYFYWTLVDNFEWERGWTQRFGLWELDVDTQVRRKRPSADLYAEICRENGLSSEMVAKYAPEVLEKIFP